MAQGNLDQLGDQDYYYIDLLAGYELHIVLAYRPLHDGGLHWYGDDSSCTDYEVHTGRITQEITSGGRYYFSVHADQSGGDYAIVASAIPLVL